MMIVENCFFIKKINFYFNGFFLLKEIRTKLEEIMLIKKLNKYSLILIQKLK